MSVIDNRNIRQPPTRLEGKPPKPILWWGLFGALVTLVIAMTMAQWILSPEFKPAPTGTDAMPEWMPIWILALEIILSSGALLFFWIFLIKPWIKEGHITWDGLFLLALATIWYQDPIDNYFNFTFTYNAHFHNMSSWANFIPGWQSPRGENFAEPYFFMGSFFMWVFFGVSILGCWLLGKLKAWLPHLSNWSHIVIVFLVFGMLDFSMESLFTHTGIFAYVAVYSPLSFWAGTAKQFPIYESTGIGALCTAVVMMRYYRDDQGNSFAEKGVQQLSLPKPAKRLLCFFAMVGAIQVMTFICFYGQYQWFALKADSFARYPSYQLLEICGKETPYACPTHEVPMPKRNSLAITPDDPRLSADSKQN